jgi:hypothetical protein
VEFHRVADWQDLFGVGVPHEISNAVPRRFPAMRAGNIRERSCPPEIIKKLITFLILAVKHPEAAIYVHFVHSNSLKSF